MKEIFPTFRGEIIPAHWQIDKKWDNQDIPEGQVIGYAPPVRHDKKDPAQKLVWESGWIVGRSVNR